MSELDAQQKTPLEKMIETGDQRMRHLIESLVDAVVAINHEGVVEYANPAAQSLFGRHQHELVGEPFGLPALGGADADIQVIRPGGDIAHAEMRVVDSEWEGEKVRIACLRDVTAQREMESQVRQLQKMEALGRLAGGVAHDFNNLLTTIIGNAQLVLSDLQKGDPLSEDIQEIKRAGERGAALTRQLLAFSRKQVVEPVVLDLNELIRNLEKMLRRMIGEDVRLEMALDPCLHTTKADLGQMEQVFMNLAVNARDAMPDGGSLFMKTENACVDETVAARDGSLVPGHYVLISVADTGAGMDEWVKLHLFEPFFTTKDAGKGTGLGLSTVYGIVKQAGGHISVHSEAGKGTTFKIYLPKADDAQETLTDQKSAVEILTGTETVLVVEDEETIRDMVRKILEAYGYEVLVAGNGEEASRCLEGSGCPVHLALVDLVLPDINGVEVARKLHALSPNLKVLFTSGYPEDMLHYWGKVKPDVNFITKPFSMTELVQRIRVLLSEP